MKTYLHLKSERNDCFQTLEVKHKFARKNGTLVGAIPKYVLFISRWRTVKATPIPSDSAPYTSLRYYIGKKSESERFTVQFVY